MSDDNLLARLDAETSRPWLRDLRTDQLVSRARGTAESYAHIRLADESGVVGELLDLLGAVTDRLASTAPSTSGINGLCDRSCAPGRPHQRECVNYFDPSVANDG